jgi:hypothetical protein
MPAKNNDLHGKVPDRAEVALLLIDVINDLEFPGSEPLTVCISCSWMNEQGAGRGLVVASARSLNEHVPIAE